MDAEKGEKLPPYPQCTAHCESHASAMGLSDFRYINARVDA